MRVVNSETSVGTGIADGNTVTATLEIPRGASKLVLSVDNNADGPPSSHDLEVTTDGDGELANEMYLAASTGNSSIPTESIDAIEGTATITVTNGSGGGADFRIQALAAAEVK